MAEALNAKELLKKHTRRDLLKTSGIVLAGGATAGAATRVGLGYAANSLLASIAEAERQVRKAVADIRALTGEIEKKLAYQTEQLEKHYNANILKKFEELGIAEPADIKQFEQIIKNSKEFEDYYCFAERAREFKDRIDQRLLSLDEKLENMQPEFLRKINDTIREFYGKKSGRAGVEYRKSMKARLDELCKLYDTNEDNRIAQAEVLKKLNHYLEKAAELRMQPEERELYQFLKQQCEQGDSKRVRDFIKNYDRFEGRNEVLISLRAYLTEAEELFAKIRDNKEYILKLQGLLKDGIKQAEQIRATAEADFAKHREEISASIAELKEAVDSTIKELKKKGYEIETRQDYIDSGKIAAMAKTGIIPLANITSAIAGIGAAVLTFLYRRKNTQLRATKSALDEAVNKYNKGWQDAS